MFSKLQHVLLLASWKDTELLCQFRQTAVMHVATIRTHSCLAFGLAWQQAHERSAAVQQQTELVRRAKRAHQLARRNGNVKVIGGRS